MRSMALVAHFPHHCSLATDRRSPAMAAVVALYIAVAIAGSIPGLYLCFGGRNPRRPKAVSGLQERTLSPERHTQLTFGSIPERSMPGSTAPSKNASPSGAD